MYNADGTKKTGEQLRERTRARYRIAKARQRTIDGKQAKNGEIQNGVLTGKTRWVSVLRMGGTEKGTQKMYLITINGVGTFLGRPASITVR